MNKPKLPPLGDFMNEESYKHVLSNLPENFDLDQFTISFIHCFPDENVSILVHSTFDEIKHHLYKDVLGKVLQKELRLTKRMEKIRKEEYWTKNIEKESFIIQR